MILAAVATKSAVDNFKLLADLSLKQNSEKNEVKEQETIEIDQVEDSKKIDQVEPKEVTQVETKVEADEEEKKERTESDVNLREPTIEELTEQVQFTEPEFKETLKKEKFSFGKIFGIKSKKETENQKVNIYNLIFKI